MKQTRRDFLNVTSAAVAGITGASSIDLAAAIAQAPPAMTGGHDPDLIVINAKVYTMDTRAPRSYGPKASAPAE